jgi:hypothetical protein
MRNKYGPHKLVAGTLLALFAILSSSVEARKVSAASGTANTYDFSAFDSTNSAFYVAGADNTNVSIRRSTAGTAAAPVTTDLTPVVNSIGTINGVTATAEVLRGKAINHIAMAGTTPIVVPQIATDNAKIYAITDPTVGTVLLESNDDSATDKTKLQDFTDTGAAYAGGVARMAAFTIGTDEYVAAALTPNGQAFGTALAFSAAATGCLRLLKRDGANKLEDKGLAKLSGTAVRLSCNAAGATYLGTVLGTKNFNQISAMHWDPTTERLYIGTKDAGSTIENKVNLMVGRVDTDSIELVGAAPLLAGADKNIVSFQSGTIGTAGAYSMNHINSMETSTGGHYIIVQCDQSIDQTEANLPTHATSSRGVFALPVVKTNATVANIGKLAVKGGFTTPATTAAHMHQGAADIAIANIDPEALVGGALAPVTSSASITDMQVAGDTVYISSKPGASGEGDAFGIFASTAIFDVNGIIKGWTAWTRVGGINSEVFNIAIDQSTGNFWMSYKGTTTADTIGVTEWGAGRGVASLDDIEQVGLYLGEKFPASSGGIFSAKSFQNGTPSIGTDNGWSVFTGLGKVALVAMATGNYPKTIVPDLGFTAGSAEMDDDLSKLYSGGALSSINEIYCSEVSRSAGTTNGWLFAGGQKGLAVLAKTDGTGWSGAVGAGLVNKTSPDLSIFSFKLLPDIPGPVYALHADGTNVYAMTDKALYKIAMTAGKFKSTTPDALAATKIYDCAVDEYMLAMEGVAGGPAAIKARGFIATTKAIYYNTDWNAATQNSDFSPAARTVTPPAGMFVQSMKFLQGGKAVTTGNVVGNLYVTYGSITANSSKVYRYQVKGTIVATDVTALDGTNTVVITAEAAGYIDLGSLKSGTLPGMGVGYNWVSKHLTADSLVNHYPLAARTSATVGPVSTSQVAVSNDANNLNLGTEPHYIANLLHNSANGGLMMVGSFGLRVNE